MGPWQESKLLRSKEPILLKVIRNPDFLHGFTNFFTKTRGGEHVSLPAYADNTVLIKSITVSTIRDFTTQLCKNLLHNLLLQN